MTDQQNMPIVDYDVPEIVANGPMFLGHSDGLLVATLTTIRHSFGEAAATQKAHVTSRVVMTPRSALRFAELIHGAVSRPSPPSAQGAVQRRPKPSRVAN